MGERQHMGWKGVAVASTDGVPSPGTVTPKETGFGGMKRMMEPQRNQGVGIFKERRITMYLPEGTGGRRMRAEQCGFVT